MLSPMHRLAAGHLGPPSPRGAAGQRTLALVAVAVLALTTIGGATAARADPGPEKRQRRVSFCAEDADLHALLGAFGKLGRFDIVVPDSVSGRVSTRMQRVSWKRALRAILEKNELDQTRIGQVLVIKPAAATAQHEKMLKRIEVRQQTKKARRSGSARPRADGPASEQSAAAGQEKPAWKRRIELDLTEVDILDILRLLSSVGRCKVLVSEQDAGTVTVSARRAKVHNLLHAVLWSQGLTWNERGDRVEVFSLQEAPAARKQLGTLDEQAKRLAAAAQAAQNEPPPADPCPPAATSVRACGFTLDQLRLLGLFSTGRQRYALLADPNDRPLTIRKGDRIAKEGFTVAAIRSGEVVFRKTVQNRSGQTLTHSATLKLKNPAGCP